MFYQSKKISLGTGLINSAAATATGARKLILINTILKEQFSNYLSDSCHCVHPPPLSAGGGRGRGLSLQPIFQKGGLDSTSTFRGVLLGKREVAFFRGRGVVIDT